MAVRMDGVVRSQQTGQRAAHGGRLENLLDLRDAWQDVIARVALFGQHGVDPATDMLVNSRRQIGLDLEVSVDNELPHCRVIE